MKRILVAAGVLAIPLHAAPPEPAAQPHSRAAKGEAAPAASARAPGRSVPGYRSAFAEYRPFDPEVPAKGWREANEEVRKAGGQAGMMSHGEKKEAGR